MVEMGRWGDGEMGSLRHPLPPAIGVGPGAEKGEISPASAFGSWGISGSAAMQKQQGRLGRLWEDTHPPASPHKGLCHTPPLQGGAGMSLARPCRAREAPDPERLGSLPP